VALVVPRVARLLALGRLDVGRHRLRDPQPCLRVLLDAPDLVAGQHAGPHRIKPADSRRHLAVGDALYLKRVQAAELGDLVEGQARVLDQPDGRGLRHQRSIHAKLPGKASRKMRNARPRS
jgi:hypothetical protein